MASVTSTADEIRTIERDRLRALVEADLEVAEQLHADDFQLINPAGGVVTKAEYLGGIASGYLNYRVWEPDSDIDVRLFDQVALIPLSLAPAHVDGWSGGSAPALLAHRHV